mgnify:CR=1 FL=1
MPAETAFTVPDITRWVGGALMALLTWLGIRAHKRLDESATKDDLDAAEASFQRRLDEMMQRVEIGFTRSWDLSMKTVEALNSAMATMKAFQDSETLVMGDAYRTLQAAIKELQART